MSNMKLILLVVSVFFLLIFFGHSPMDEMRKKRAEKAGRKLVEKIEESNKKNPKGTAQIGAGTPRYMGTGSTFNPNSTPRGGNPPQPGYTGNGDVGAAPVNRYNNGPNPFLNPGQQNLNDPAYAAKNANRPKATPKDDYYPPAPTNRNIKIPLSANDPKNLSKAARIANKALADPNTITDDGRQLAFSGTKVFFYNANGGLMPAPDGKYAMYDGRWVMVVRGGQQTVANGDTTNWGAMP